MAKWLAVFPVGRRETFTPDFRGVYVCWLWTCDDGGGNFDQHQGRVGGWAAWRRHAVSPWGRAAPSPHISLDLIRGFLVLVMSEPACDIRCYSLTDACGHLACRTEEVTRRRRRRGGGRGGRRQCSAISPFTPIPD